MVGQTFKLKGRDGKIHAYTIIRQDKDGMYKIAIDGIPERRRISAYHVERYAEMEKEATAT